MNLFFCGKIPLERARRHAERMRALSKEYVPAEPEVIFLADEKTRWISCVLRGLNRGIGFHDDGEVMAIVDGEIYNPSVLAPGGQRGKGPAFRDMWAEGVAKGYRKDGMKWASRLNGIFSIVIYNRAEKQVVLFRDPKGYRMLYYHLDEDHLILSNRLWSVAALCGRPPERNVSVEPFHFIYGFCPQGKTVVNGINKVKPGSSLVVDMETAKCRERAYPIDDVIPIPRGDLAGDMDQGRAKRILYEAFMESVDEVSGFERRVAVLLGGLDSAAVAAALKRLGRHVETFSFKWPEERYNQKNIEPFIQFVGVKHHWMPIDMEFVRYRLRKMPQYVDEPRSELTYLIGTTELCGMARRMGFNLVATGDEAESTMGGYPALHNMVFLIERAKRCPKILLRVLIALIGRPFFLKRFGHAARNVLTVLRQARQDGDRRYFLVFHLLDHAEIPRLLNGGWAECCGLDLEEQVERLFAPFRGIPGLFIAHRGNEIGASIRFKHAAPAGIYDVAMTSPFLHRGFVDVVRGLNSAVLYPHGTRRAEDAKWLFREMVKDYKLLPQVVSDQKKLTPGDSPIDHWLQNELREEALEMIRGLGDGFSHRFIEEIFERKWFMGLYRKYLGVSAVTSHAQQALVGYALFWSHLCRCVEEY